MTFEETISRTWRNAMSHYVIEFKFVGPHGCDAWLTTPECICPHVASCFPMCLITASTVGTYPATPWRMSMHMSVHMSMNMLIRMSTHFHAYVHAHIRTHTASAFSMVCSSLAADVLMASTIVIGVVSTLMLIWDILDLSVNDDSLKVFRVN